MDIALAIDYILPGAVYAGSVTANTQTSYDAIAWDAVANTIAKPSWDAIVAADKAARMPRNSDVDAERDARVNGGLTFQGVEYQTNVDSRAAIESYSGLHSMALQLDADPEVELSGDLSWGGMLDEDMYWFATDNTRVPMDVDTFGEFLATLAAHTSRHKRKARDLKDMNPIPENFTDDRYWTG